MLTENDKVAVAKSSNKYENLPLQPYHFFPLPLFQPLIFKNELSFKSQYDLGIGNLYLIWYNKCHVCEVYCMLTRCEKLNTVISSGLYFRHLPLFYLLNLFCFQNILPFSGQIAQSPSLGGEGILANTPSLAGHACTFGESIFKNISKYTKNMPLLQKYT